MPPVCFSLCTLHSEYVTVWTRTLGADFRSNRQPIKQLCPPCSLITFGSVLGLVSHHVELREEEALATGRAVVRGPLAQSACGRLGWRGHGRGGLEGRVVCRSGRWLLPGLPPRWGWWQYRCCQWVWAGGFISAPSPPTVRPSPGKRRLRLFPRIPTAHVKITA